MMRYILGVCEFTVEGLDLDMLGNELLKACRVISYSINDDRLYISVSFADKEKAIKHIKKYECVYKIIKETGFLRYLCAYRKRFGLAFGAVISLCLAILLSNIVMKVEIINSSGDDPMLNEDIIAVLEDMNVRTGAVIPMMDFRVIESELYELFDEIAWISVGHEGSVITVNISCVTERADKVREHSPSNIVAARGGVIVDTRVLAGELDVLIGSAVAEGDVLISGIVDRRNGTTYYYHSMGQVIAEFEEEITLRQDYLAVTQIVGKSKMSYAIRLFDFEIPLGFNSKGNYREECEILPIKLFGFITPFSVVKYKYSEISEDITMYSEAEAESEIMRRIDIYEKFSLKNYEIINKDLIKSTDEGGITITVKYKLKGDIGMQQPIFIDR